MIKSTLALILCVSPIAANAVEEVGVGAVVGDPTGLNAKLWFDARHAVDFGLGYSGDTAIWGDVLWHDWTLLPQPAAGMLGAYLGLGPRFEAARDAEFGARALAGLSWRLPRQRAELFLEAGPVFRATPRGGVAVDAGFGVRVYLDRVD